MVLEVALIDVLPGNEDAFAAAYAQATRCSPGRPAAARCG